MTSTYDHRIIQGAESGASCRRIEELPAGRGRLLRGVFADARRRRSGPRRRRRRSRSSPRPPRRRAAAAPRRRRRRPRSCCRPSRPRPRCSRPTARTATSPRASTRSAPSRRATRRSSPRTVDLTPELMAQIPAEILRDRRRRARRCRRAAAPARDLLRHDRLRDRAHRLATSSASGCASTIETGAYRTPLDRRASSSALLQPPDRGRRARALPAQGLPRPEAVLDRGPRHDGPDARRARSSCRRARGAQEVVIGMAHRGRLNVLAHNLGRPYETILAEFEGATASRREGGHRRSRRAAPATSSTTTAHEGAYELPRRRARSSVSLESEPEPPRVRRPGRRRAPRAPRRPSRAGPARPRTTPTPRSRSSSTATPPSPARAWSPRRSTCRRSTATRSAARSTSSRTTRSASRPTPRRRARPRYAVRPGEGLRRPDHPRQRRRRRGLHRRGAAGDGLPRGVRPRRRHRPDRLPPLRPQRDRRARLHAAGDVRARSRSTQRGLPSSTPSSWSRRASSRRRRSRPGDQERLGRAHAAATSELQGADRGGARTPDRRAATGEYRARPHAEPERRDRGPGRAAARRSTRSCCSVPEGFTVHPQARQAARAPPRGARRRRRHRLGARRGARVRLAARPRACRSASPARTPSAAPSASATWSCTTRRPGQTLLRRSRTCRGALAPFELHNSPLSEIACLGLRVRLLRRRRPRRSCSGRRSSATSSTRRQVIIDQFIVSRPGEVGPDLAPDAAAAARLRGLGPRALLARGSSASCSSPPRATSASPTRPRRRSTSTCCAARRGSPSSARWSS